MIRADWGTYGRSVHHLDHPRYMREGAGDRIERAVCSQRAWEDRELRQLDRLLEGRGFARACVSTTSSLESGNPWRQLEHGTILQWQSVRVDGPRGYSVTLTRYPEGLETWALTARSWSTVARGCSRASLLEALDSRRTTSRRYGASQPSRTGL